MDNSAEKISTAKIAHLSTYEDKDGASKAVSRLHKSLRENNINGTLIVNEKEFDSGNNYIKNTQKKFLSQIAPYIEYYLPKIFYNSNVLFSSSLIGSQSVSKIKEIKSADLICLYWINGAFLSINQIGRLIALNKPVIWRLSDMWPFTGGCHYSGGCNRYEDQCGFCQQLKSNLQWDLSCLVLKLKKKYFQCKNLTIVAPSNWIANCASKSAIFKNLKIEVIPTGVDTATFKPFPKKQARNFFKLPKDRKLVLFGAINSINDTRKGADLLIETLRKYKEIQNNNIDLVIFGNNNEQFKINGYNCYLMGIINDEHSLALLYSACDLFIAPSREENFANTVLESLGCGTPVLAFNIGGMPDAVDHKQNGYLAIPFDIEDMANGMSWLLSHEHPEQLKEKALKKVKKTFSQDISISKYIDLYKKNLVITDFKEAE
jgi:glycosyltransferase involved in cell wall biosynthesis